MKTIGQELFLNEPSAQQFAIETLRDHGGLVCFPCSANYRIAASLESEAAVMTLLQAKRRSKHTPALVMVADVEMLAMFAQEIPPPAAQLIKALWPGNVTLRLPLSKAVPSKVYKELAKPDKKVGFRLPCSPVAQVLVQGVRSPLLISSANLFKRPGAASVAAIKKSFSRVVDVMVDAGDLPPTPPSTVVDFDEAGIFQLIREGAVSRDALEEALRNAA